MNKIHDWKAKLRRGGRGFVLGLFGVLVLAGGAATPRAQEPPTQADSPQTLEESQEGFYDIDQLEKLFQIARESGFSDQDIREITIEDEQGRTVNAWDYLQEVKKRRAMREKADQEKLSKIYLTVQDILSDLRKREKDDLRKLRDKTAFEQ